MFMLCKMVFGVVVSCYPAPAQHHVQYKHEAVLSDPANIEKAINAGKLDLGGCAGSPNLQHKVTNWFQHADSICNRQNASTGP